MFWCFAEPAPGLSRAGDGSFVAMRFEQEQATLGWPFPLLGCLPASPILLNTLVGWRVLSQLTAAQKLSIGLQEAHGEITINGLYDLSLSSERDGHGGKLEMSPPGVLQEFSSPRPISFWLCINFPFTQLKCLTSDSKI